MSIASATADAYKRVKNLKKIRTYGKLITQAIDDDTRPGALMNLGIRGMLEIAGKALGTSLTSHPYFKFHKVHLEALGQALNASSNKDAAMEALNRAIRSADSAQSLTKVLGDYQFRKNALKLTYFSFIADSLALLRDYRTNPQAARDIKDAGHTPESLKAFIDQSIYEWRARWCELFLDSVNLLAMAQVELRASEAAMEQFEKKMKAMSKGGNIGRIAAYSVEQERQWQEYERMTEPGGGSVQAIENPEKFARDQVHTIEEVTDRLGENCELAMGDDAYNPATMARQGSR
jgi:hypothetical protein